MTSHIERWFRERLPAVDFCSLRRVDEYREQLSVRRDRLQPLRRRFDRGAMLTVIDCGGCGYAATADLSDSGLDRAFAEARNWARRTAGRLVFEARAPQRPPPQGDYRSTVGRSWAETAVTDKLERLMLASRRLRAGEAIVDWQAALGHSRRETLYLDSAGGRVSQYFECLQPVLEATAERASQAQSRSFGGGTRLGQGGLEQLDAWDFDAAAERIGEQALALVAAPDCPEGILDLVLAPDQMVLQIHESIGHPLELDRILGDERNYAGTSFVTPDMFGRYAYGSRLLNVTFDPGVAGEVAGYGFDDDGTPAERAHLIRDGILLRPLGGALSQTRAGLAGVANARACHWNRAPIDRMANLNLEPGTGTLAGLVSRVERGVYLETNRSWSIDDSRNKFQFGCEYGRRIVDGELREVVRNANYRGISAGFWRSLDGVGEASTVEVLGAGDCGKGEPNQALTTGHAAPPCLFRNVSVFGGA